MAFGLSQGNRVLWAWPQAWPFALLLAYVTLVVALQTAVSPTIELDQAEQLVLAQRLEWGYTNQPPLYTWLVWGVGTLIGQMVGALKVVKIGLTTLLVVACDGAGRALQLSSHQRRVAAAGLALLPAVVWEAQRDLTHSLLCAALAASVLWSVLASLRRPAWWRDVLTGVLAGGAMLAKQNVLLFLAVLPAALLVCADTRPQVRWRSLAVAGLVAVLVWLPHGAWLWQHPQSLSRTVEKLHQGASAGSGAWQGAVLAVLSFLLPWGLFAVPMYWQSRKPAPAGRFLGCLALGVALCLLLIIVALRVDNFNPRWLFSMLFFMPLWLAASTRPDIGRWSRWMVYAGLSTAVIAAVALPGRIAWPEAKPTRLNTPYAELAAGLRQQWGGVPDVMLATNHLDGGNLKAALGEDVDVMTPVVPWSDGLPAEVIIVAREQDWQDEKVRRWFVRVAGRSPDEVAWQGRVSAPLLYRPESPLVRLTWARLKLRPSAGP